MVGSMNNIEECSSKFIEYLIIDKKYSENTVKSYNNDLKKFEGLSICEEYNDFYIMNNISNIYSNLNDKRNEFEIELKNMMINIQKRKNILLNLKKQINEKKPKIEFRKK